MLIFEQPKFKAMKTKTSILSQIKYFMVWAFVLSFNFIFSQNTRCGFDEILEYYNNADSALEG